MRRSRRKSFHPLWPGMRSESKLACRDGAQLIPQMRSALRTERALEMRLRVAPQLSRGTKPLRTRFGQVQLLAPSIRGSVLDDDESVTLQGQHGSSQCRSV